MILKVEKSLLKRNGFVEWMSTQEQLINLIGGILKKYILI